MFFYYSYKSTNYSRMWIEWREIPSNRYNELIGLLRKTVDFQWIFLDVTIQWTDADDTENAGQHE